MAEGVIVNYRRGRKTQRTNQVIVILPETDKEGAMKLVGKEAVYTIKGKKNTKIKGKIQSTHGDKGALRVLFERGIPGQAIGKKLEVKM